MKPNTRKYKNKRIRKTKTKTKIKPKTKVKTKSGHRGGANADFPTMDILYPKKSYLEQY